MFELRSQTGPEESDDEVGRIKPNIDPTMKKIEEYRSFAAFIGIWQIIGGVFSCLLCAGTILIASQNKVSWHPCLDATYMAPGIWCGFVLIATGAVALSSERFDATYMQKASPIVSLIAMLFMIPLIYLPYQCFNCPISVPRVAICSVFTMIIGGINLVDCLIQAQHSYAAEVLAGGYPWMWCKKKTEKINKQKVNQLANGQVVLAVSQLTPAVAVVTPSGKAGLIPTPTQSMTLRPTNGYPFPPDRDGPMQEMKLSLGNPPPYTR